MFSMTDKVVHTGFMKMSPYLFAVGMYPKPLHWNTFLGASAALFITKRRYFSKSSKVLLSVELNC